MHFCTYTLLIATLLLSLTFGTVPSQKDGFIDYDSQLFNDIMEKYNPLTLPQTGELDQPSRFDLEIQLQIYGIDYIDVTQGTAAFKVAFRQWWNDTRMVWNSSDYGNIKMFWLPSDSQAYPRIWKADMHVRQDIGEYQLLSNLKNTYARVYSNGLCYLSAFGQIAVTAQFDLNDYPYDIQTINMTIGSWNIPDDRIHLKMHDPPFLVQDKTAEWKTNHIEWDFLDYTVDKLNIFTTGAYERVNFSVRIQRSGGTILISIMIPGALITFLGILYILLPRGTGQRTDYLATVLLTEIMFLVMITSFVPISKAIPSLGWLFLSYVGLLSTLTLAVLIIDKVQLEFADHLEESIRKLVKQDPEEQEKQDQAELENAPISESLIGPQRTRFQSEASRKKAVNAANNTEYSINTDTEMQSKIEGKYDAEIKARKLKLARITKLLDRIDLGIFICSLIGFTIITIFLMGKLFQ